MVSTWFDSKQRAFVFRGEHVEKAVRALADVAEPLLQLDEQRLAAKLLPSVVEDNALQLPRPWNAALTEAGDEDVPPPVRKLVAGVEGHARGADRRQPDDGRILHAVARGMTRDPASRSCVRGAAH